MKKVYVTYKENNVLKKAVITESRFQELNSNTQIQELIIYPSQLIMEQNFSTKCSDGSCKPNKNILHG